ncbi:unnamed protein product [Leptosia nina]|uniref:CCR4-NOT transcription complex subunit 10 n=1 Tax=Leptosia nina TaxID=320188 RepID=A0AAV1IZL1_9NEOP
MANNSEDPAILAHQCYLKKDYASALQHLNELENLVGNDVVLLKRIHHNKAVVELAASDMKNIDKFQNSITECVGVKYPDEELEGTASPFAIYNYAVLLYHSRYYYQSTVILEKLLLSKTIKDKTLLHHALILLLECTLCRRSYEKTIEIANCYGDTFKPNDDLNNVYQRLVCRAQVFLGQKFTLKPDSIENIVIIAQQQYVSGNINESADTLGMYKVIKTTYNTRSEGEDIWAAINNNLGVIFLSIKKPYLAAKYFQNALKEHFKTLEAEDIQRLIICKDRPIYIYNLGLALLATKNIEGAFECLVEAARHYPNNPLVWVRLAECCIKKCCNDEVQKFTVKKLGSGSHTRVLVAREKEKYSLAGESFAIPSLSLEFAALCLRNAITLLPNEDAPIDATHPFIQAPPGPPINWKQRCELKNSIHVLQSYIFLHLQDPLAALVSANELLSQTDALKSHITWAHIYAAEALIILDKTVEAIEHLQPTIIQELVSGFPDQMRDIIGVSVWAKAAVCNILRGDLLQARKILQQISSSKILPLQMRWIFLLAAVVVSIHFSIIIFMLSPIYGIKGSLYGGYSHLGLRQPSVSWCKELRLRIPPSSVVALVSYPGSGNTWLRYLLQQATGIMTGSIYMDYGLRVHGFPAENVTNGSVLVVKTHEGPPSDNKFQAAILLIRNPRDAILFEYLLIKADFNRIHKGHIGTAPKSAFKRRTREHKSDWATYVSVELGTWENTHKLWLTKFSGAIYIVHYEVLVRDTKRVLYGILNFLNYTVTEDDMNCALTNKEGIYRRRKKHKDFDPFTPNMYAALQTVQQRVIYMITDYQRTHNQTY